MRKIIICLAITLAISTGVAIRLNASHVIVDTICANNPGKNCGTCLERAEGHGYSCVIAGLWPIDCYAMIEDPS